MKGILRLIKLVTPPTPELKVIWRLEVYLVTDRTDVKYKNTLSSKEANDIYKDEGLYQIVCRYLTTGHSIAKELPLSQKDYEYAMYHRLLHDEEELDVEEDFYMVDNTEEARRNHTNPNSRIESAEKAIYYIKIVGDDIKWYTIWREFKATGEQWDKEFYTWIKKHYFAPQNKKS